MINKTYLTQFNTSKGTGRKRLSKLKSALTGAGIFWFQEPGNTPSYSAVYVHSESLTKAWSLHNRLLMEESVQGSRLAR